MFPIALYQEVTLTRDLPEYALKTGDIVTLVDFFDHPSVGEAGCILEVFNVIGESIATIAVPITAIAALRSDEILTVCSLATARYSFSQKLCGDS